MKVKKMRLTITDSAYQWFKEELDTPKDEGIRIYGKYGGSTAVHTNVSVGLEIAQPRQPMVTEKLGELTFFIEEDDEWFFHGYDLIVDYDSASDEPIYQFVENAA